MGFKLAKQREFSIVSVLRMILYLVSKIKEFVNEQL